MTKDGLYFPFHSNTSRDPRIQLLMLKHGNAGFGIYVLILEILRESSDLKYPLEYEPILANNFNIPLEDMEDIINNYKLFKFDDDGYFYSPELINNLIPFLAAKQKKRIGGIKSGQARRVKIENNEELKSVPNTNESVRNTNESVRNTNESVRNTNESVRNINKSVRNTNESVRNYTRLDYTKLEETKLEETKLNETKLKLNQSKHKHTKEDYTNPILLKPKRSTEQSLVNIERKVIKLPTDETKKDVLKDASSLPQKEQKGSSLGKDAEKDIKLPIDAVKDLDGSKKVKTVFREYIAMLVDKNTVHTANEVRLLWDDLGSCCKVDGDKIKILKNCINLKLITFKPLTQKNKKNYNFKEIVEDKIKKGEVSQDDYEEVGDGKTLFQKNEDKKQLQNATGGTESAQNEKKGGKGIGKGVVEFKEPKTLLYDKTVDSKYSEATRECFRDYIIMREQKIKRKISKQEKIDIWHDVERLGSNENEQILILKRALETGLYKLKAIDFNSLTTREKRELSEYPEYFNPDKLNN
jgi:hypothetical protein